MSVSAPKNSFKSIIKGTSVFGGVQVVQILLSLVRGKFVALLLGPSGMGVAALYASATTMLQQTASLGLNLAVVKEIASSNDDAPHRRSIVIAIARRLISTSALIGGVVCLLLSPWLSEWSFGSRHYTGAFALLSVMVAFAIAGAGEMSILQGMHEVKRLSRSSIVGGCVGLLVGVPLYYFFGNDGIAPAMVLLSLSTFVFYYSSAQRASAGSIKPANKRLLSSNISLVRKLLGLGMVLLAGQLLGSLTNYLIGIIVRSLGSVDSVGMYQAANSLTNQYVGVVFTAMSLDYFPRLTAIATDNEQMRTVVNRQTQVVGLLLTPLVALLMLTAPIIIRLLLTDEFLTVVPLMRWMGLGVLLRGLNYPMGYISFAKDNKRLFFLLEGVWGNMLNLGVSALAFWLWGLIGLGVAIVVCGAASWLVYYAVNHRLYAYSLDRAGAHNTLMSIIIGGGVFGASCLTSIWTSYTIMTILTVLSITYSIVSLRRIWHT